MRFSNIQRERERERERERVRDECVNIPSFCNKTHTFIHLSYDINGP